MSVRFLAKGTRWIATIVMKRMLSGSCNSRVHPDSLENSRDGKLLGARYCQPGKAPTYPLLKFDDRPNNVHYFMLWVPKQNDVIIVLMTPDT